VQVVFNCFSHKKMLQVQINKNKNEIL